MTEDQGTQTKIEAKRLKIEHYVRQSGLHDYHNKTPNDELATVPCLDIEALRRAMANWLIKLLR